MKLTTTTQVSVDGVVQGPGAPVAGIAERYARAGVGEQSTPQGITIQAYRPTEAREVKAATGRP